MIKFYCKHCGQQIGVPAGFAGGGARCPKCKKIIVMPEAENAEPVADQSDFSDSKGGAKYVGFDLALFDIPPEDAAANQLSSQGGVSEKDLEELHKPVEKTTTNETESVGERKLPFFIDIFLYPISASGMVHLAILSFLPRMLLPLGHLSYWLHPPIFGLGFLVIFMGYLLCCLSDCIRDSANGGRRAPNIDISPTVLLHAGELISPVLKVFVCFTVCIGPLFAYFIVTRRTDLIFWLLVTYGVLFLPMVLLATVLFDSLRSLNPVLIIASTVTVFLPYCGLVLLFFTVGGLIAVIVSILPQSRLISYTLSAVCVYLTMVMAHLLGRFYWRNQEKLNWEV